MADIARQTSVQSAAMTTFFLPVFFTASTMRLSSQAKRSEARSQPPGGIINPGQANRMHELLFDADCLG
jgi:hypothetical protein